MGTGWTAAGNLGASVVGSVPNAVIALLSGGSSLSGNTSAALAQTAASQGSGLGATITSSVQSLIKNPSFWTSVAQTTGPAYDEAKASGSSEPEATAAGLITGLTNSIVEMGGGLETLPSSLQSGSKSAIREWVSSMLGEGKEEVIQGVIENLTAKMVYDEDRAWVSTSDTDAVINPVRAAQEFAGGALAGGILGGVQAGVVNAVNSNSNTNTDTDLYSGLGSRFSNMGDEAIQSIIDTGLESDTNTESYQYAQRAQNILDRGGTLTDDQLGRLYAANVEAVNAEEQTGAQNTMENTLEAPAGSTLMAPVTAQEIIQDLTAQGVDAQTAQALGEAIAAITNGETISGNQAAKIAQNEQALAELEALTGTTINTDAPLSQVKTAVQNAASGAETAQTVSTDMDTSEAVSAAQSDAGARIDALVRGETTTQTSAQTAQTKKADVSALGVNAGQAGIYLRTSGLSEQAVQAAVDSYDGNTEALTDYLSEFVQVYSAAKSGQTLPTTKTLSLAQRVAASEAGVGDALRSQHINERTMADVGKRNVKYFQFDHPQLHEYFAETARAFLGDLSSSVKGERFPLIKDNSIVGYSGTTRHTTDAIAQMRDEANLSYADIDKALQAIINDNGQENYAAAKRVELILDDALTNGYTDIFGNEIPPNEAYIEAKEKIPGAPEVEQVEDVGDEGLPLWIEPSPGDGIKQMRQPGKGQNSRNSTSVLKSRQWAVIQESNPAEDSIHTWIRSAEEIKTFQETLNDPDWADGSDFGPDYTWQMAQEAAERGEIRVYSSDPISPGAFVTPSRMEAESYSGNGSVHEKTVKLTDVAWIDPTQGQYTGADSSLRGDSSGATMEESTQGGTDNGGTRKESGAAFLRRATGEGYGIIEGDTAVYGFRRLAEGQSARQNAGQVQEELKALGINADIIADNVLLRNKNGLTTAKMISQAATVGGEHTFISDGASVSPRNAAGHEAFHLWKSGTGWDVYISVLEDNLIYNSEAFRAYQSEIAQAYLGSEADFTDSAQMKRLREELFAYISGDVHEGTNDEFLSPMFRDYDAVAQAWEQLVQANRGTGTQSSETGSKKSDIQRSTSGSPSHPEEWTATRIKSGKSTQAKPVSDIISSIRHDFGLNVTYGHVRGKGVRGQFNARDKGIRSKIANDLPTVAHELGHGLDDRYGITSGRLSKQVRSELWEALGDLADSYPESEADSEGLAEFLRKFLQNRETAAIDYPNLTDHVLKSLSGKDRQLLEQLSDDVNAYYSLDAETAQSSIRLREEGAVDLRTATEKIQDMGDAFYQAWIDSNHGIRLFDQANGSNVYKLATNSAYSDAVAGQLITGDLTDINGQYVGPGLKAALNGINTRSKTEYKAFSEYLVVRHGVEYLADGKRVFADDRKNSTTWMNERRAALEKQYPQFEAAAERLYKFVNDLTQTWGVDTGLIEQSTFDEWKQRWPDYVPFNWAVEKKGLAGARRGYANQSSPVKRAKGSGLDIVSPVDNVVDQIVLFVNAGTRNNVMRQLRGAALETDANAAFMEKVPTPLAPKKVDMSGVKSILENAAANDDSITGIDALTAALPDVLTQFERGRAKGDVVTVMVDRQPEYWKINDKLLLESVTNMKQPALAGFLSGYAKTTRLMTANITGNNPVWSIFSNAPRDLMTFAMYSKNKSPFKAAAALGSSYVNSFNERIRGGKGSDPYYAEYLAMGGGHTSAYNSDADLAKKARKSLTATKAQRIRDTANPLNMISFISDTIEEGPRFATYRMCRQAGLTPQEAFYEAVDVTVNFRRGGVASRNVSKVVPFFNASVQGIDKFGRHLSAEDAKGTNHRARTAGVRWATLLTASAVLGALMYGLNNRDEESKKNYQQLSNYTKNSYFCIPLGDGMYFTIPKARELSVLASFFETCLEAFAGENGHAFDEFWDYATDNFLPSIVSDLAQLPSNIASEGTQAGIESSLMGALGSLGLIGVGAYIGANQDFLGKPIVSATLESYEPEDQCNESTSQMAYWLWQAFGVSPVVVDYFGNNVLGYLWKVPKALFPVGQDAGTLGVNDATDYTLGVKSSYVKDNTYSQDLVNWLYDQADASAAAKKSDPEDMDKAITAAMDSRMTSLYSNFNSLNKNADDSDAARLARQTMMELISEYRKARDSGDLTDVQEKLYAIVQETGDTSYLPSTLSAQISDGYGDDETKYSLDANQYLEYQTAYLGYFWDYLNDRLDTDASIDDQALIVTKAKQVAKARADEDMLAQLGVSQDGYSSYEVYESAMDTVTASSLWSSADSEQQADIEELAWSIYSGSSDGVALQEKIDGGSKYGLSEDEYLLYRLALSIVDEPTASGNLGSYTQAEVEAAIRKVPGLTQKEKAYLWQSQNAGWSADNNPFG